MYAEQAVFTHNHLDLSGALSRLKNDRRLLGSLLSAFMLDVPRRVGALRAAVAAGDHAGTVQQANSLVGATSVVGAKRARDYAAATLDAALAHDTDACQTWLCKLEMEVETVMELVRRIHRMQ